MSNNKSSQIYGIFSSHLNNKAICIKFCIWKKIHMLSSTIYSEKQQSNEYSKDVYIAYYVSGTLLGPFHILII